MNIEERNEYKKQGISILKEKLELLIIAENLSFQKDKTLYLKAAYYPKPDGDKSKDINDLHNVSTKDHVYDDYLNKMFSLENKIFNSIESLFFVIILKDEFYETIFRELYIELLDEEYVVVYHNLNYPNKQTQEDYQQESYQIKVKYDQFYDAINKLEFIL